MSARIALALALACLACKFEVATPADTAPAFALERLGGGSVRLEDLRGKHVLIDFWATWCPPCVLEIPELNAFYEKHRDNGVELVAIAIDGDDAAELEEWARARDIRYPVALGSYEVARLYGADQFPFHILISPDGEIVERLTPGYHDRDELSALIARHTQ